MARLLLWKDIFFKAFLLCLLSQGSFGAIFYMRLQFPSLMYSESLQIRSGTAFDNAQANIGSAVKNALVGDGSNTLLTNEKVKRSEVQKFRNGVVATILIEVDDDPQIEAVVTDKLTAVVQTGKIGTLNVTPSSLTIVFKSAECNAGFVIDFATESCQPCPKDTYQKENLAGQCDACPFDKGTFNNATVAVTSCYSYCSININYCNGFTCNFADSSGIVCACPDSTSGVTRVGGKRCLPLVTFFFSFNISSQNYTDLLYNKFSVAFTEMSTWVKSLVRHMLISSNNNQVGVDAIERIFTVYFGPGPSSESGLTAYMQLDIVNTSTIESSVTTVLTNAIQAGTVLNETVVPGSLDIIFNKDICYGGIVMDFAQRKCAECPVGYYEPFGDASGLCAKCPYGTNTTSTGAFGLFTCVQFCALNPDYCMNGGTCDFVVQGTESEKGARCDCPYGYGGRLCEKEVTVVETVNPSFGPEAGGTYINISGFHFKSMIGITVVIGDSPCTDVTGNDTVIQCYTGQFNKSAFAFGQGLNLTVTYASPPESFTTENAYTYRRNPKIDNISPLATFISGGLMLTVMGRNLNGASDPKLLTKVTYTNNVTNVMKSDCNVPNSYSLHCMTPKIEPYNPAMASVTTTRKKRQTTVEISAVNIGFEFDGLAQYQDLKDNLASFSTIKVYLDPQVDNFDPEIRSFDYTSTQQVVLKGKNFNSDSFLDSLYKVMLGDTECDFLTIRANEIVCQVPQKPSNSSNYKVKVLIGGKEFYPGYLKYRSGYWNDEFTKYLIVGGALGAAALIVTVVAVWISVSTTKFMQPGGKDSYDNSLVEESISDDAESIIPNPLEGYTEEQIPKFNSARFYTSASRGRAYDNPSLGRTSNTSITTPSTRRNSPKPSLKSLRRYNKNNSLSHNSQLFMY